MLKKMKLDLAARVILILATLAATVFVIDRGRASQASCIMPTSGTVSGLTLVNDINGCNGALLSLYSGASPPSGPTTGMLWYNTGTGYIQQYDSANWNNVWYVDATNHLTTAPIGGGVPTANINSGSTTDLGSIPQAFKIINGTTTITSFGSSATAGTLHVLKFGSALTLTYNATSLILPGGLNITTAAGDIAFAIYLGSSNWQVLNYSPATGAAVSNPALPLGTVLFGDFTSPPAKTVYGGGQALARSSYPGYLTAVTRAQSMTRTSGNATLTSVADTSGFGVGNPVEGSGISAGCTIASLVANTSITLNNGTCVTASGSASITVFPTGYGSGGDSTTIGVKDCQGRAIAGLDSGRGRLTASFFGAGFNSLNGTGGGESVTLTLAQIPTGITSGNASQNITVTSNFTDIVRGSLANFSVAGGGGAISAGNGSGALTGGAATSQGTNSITVTSNNTSGQAHRTLPPMVLANCVVAVLP